MVQPAVVVGYRTRKNHSYNITMSSTNGITGGHSKTSNLNANWMKSLTPESIVKARDVFGETEEKVKTAITKVRQMIKEEGMDFDENDEYILKFLRYRKYNLQRTVQTLKYHTDLATRILSTIGLPKPEALRNILKKNFLVLLPHKDSEGRHVFLQHKVKDIMQESPTDILQLILFISFYLTHDPNTQINGIVGILNATDLSLRHMPTYFRIIKLILHLFKCNPVGFKRIYIVNASPMTYILLNIVKPLVPLKILQRATFHSDSEAILEYNSRSNLPYEYGGTLGSLSNDHLLDHLEPMCNLIKNYIMKYAT